MLIAAGGLLSAAGAVGGWARVKELLVNMPGDGMGNWKDIVVYDGERSSYCTRGELF